MACNTSLANGSQSVKLATFNMHGFNTSWSYLQDLCVFSDIIFIQEHWLTPSKLDYLHSVNSLFCCYAKSAMDDSICTGILPKGRPFGGVGVLWKKVLSKNVLCCGSSQDGRVVYIKLVFADCKLLLFGCYFPVYENSVAYSDEICAILGYIQSVVTENPESKVGLIGDFNFDMKLHKSTGNLGFTAFCDFLYDYKLECTDALETSGKGFTYRHVTLGHYSWLDHLFLDSSLLQKICDICIRDDSCNISDHMPLCFALTVPSLSNVTNECRKDVVREFRWDHGNLGLYYERTYDLLSRIEHVHKCTQELGGRCEDRSHRHDIDIYYSEIVHCLMTAAKETIPLIPKSALKHYWSAELDELKSISKDMYDLWCAASKPNHGVIFNLMKNAKYKYKLAVRHTIKSFENRVSDELYDNLIEKDMLSFWKTWNSKLGSKPIYATQINGLSSDLSIADIFADKFASISQSNPSSRFINRYQEFVSINSDDVQNKSSVPNSDVHYKPFVVEEVDNAVFQRMKRGKAPGIDGVSLEHIVYAHPSVIVHLTHLFNMIIIHGHVPDDFGKGIVIPLVKDKAGDLSDPDNYRGITISPTISKVFEICLLDKCAHFIQSHDLQLGFKKSKSCSMAIFCVQHVVNYFVNNGSNVHVASLDASKAFDRVNHFTLFSKLIECNVPPCFINVIIDWYSKLESVVKWNSVFSKPYNVSCGVRQGGILSPFLFNLYINDLLKDLLAKDYGCHVGSVFFGCFIYADDIIILSPTLCGLQEMLNVCTRYSLSHDIVFNTKKSVYTTVGKKTHNVVPSSVFLGGVALEWVKRFKYLGVTFNSGRNLRVDILCVKRKFYAACNAIFSKLGNASEPVLLHLVRSKCLPLLLYSLGAIKLSNQEVKQLSVSWNDAFRRIFHFHRWEAVKELICFCGELDFMHMYNLCRWKFLNNIHVNFPYGATLLQYLDKGIQYFECYYNCYSCNPVYMKSAVMDKFVKVVGL